VVDVVNLAKGEELPRDQDWELLERTPSGKYVGNGSVAHPKSATFYVAPAEDRETAISKAVAWAAKYGLSTVYVRDGEEHA
jgi:hypothetical protein